MMPNRGYSSPAEPGKLPPVPAGPAEQLRAQYDNLSRAMGLDIFERRGGRDEPGGYKFTCPGVMIGSDNVQIGFHDGAWHLSYTDSTGTHSGQAEDLVCAYLALIADRMGHWAMFTPKPDGNNGEADRG